MARFTGMVTAFALLFATAAASREPIATGYESYTMPGYTLVAREEYAARSLVSEIQKIDRVLGVVLNRPTRVRGSPVFVVIVPGVVWQRYLEPGTAIVGEFVPGRFSNYLLLNTGNSPALREGLYHEYTHLFLRTQYRSALPLWFDEGMAEIMQFTKIRGSSADIGLPGVSNYGWPTIDGWLPVDRLLRLDKSSPEYRDSRFSHRVHVESWALVHRGVIAQPEFGRQMFAYLDAVNKLQPIDSAIQASFGMNAELLDDSMRDYLSQTKFSVARVNFDPPAPVSLATGVPMSEVEALEFLAETMFVSGFKPQNLGEVIVAAERRAPGSPNVLVLRMKLAVRDGDDAGFLRLLAEIEPRTSDARIARGVGLALADRLRPAQTDDRLDPAARQELAERALGMLDRAIRARPDDTEAVWAYGLLSAQSKRYLNTALMRVRQAIERVPFNADLAMAAALLHEALGEPAQAIQRLQDTVRFSVSIEQRSWAVRRLDEMKKDSKSIAR